MTPADWERLERESLAALERARRARDTAREFRKDAEAARDRSREWGRLIATASAQSPVLGDAVADVRRTAELYAETVEAGRRAQEILERQRRGESVMADLMAESKAALLRSEKMLEHVRQAGERIQPRAPRTIEPVRDDAVLELQAEIARALAGGAR